MRALHPESGSADHQGTMLSSYAPCSRPSRFAPALGVILVALGASCSTQAGEPGAAERSLQVVASAYNSLPSQTDAQPALAAWGDLLEPGQRSIAVSRDLIELGLTRGAVVRIEGLPGSYRVLDKMSARWKRKIDIYMGVDREAALEWGVRPVTIRWVPSADSSAAALP